MLTHRSCRTLPLIVASSLLAALVLTLAVLLRTASASPPLGLPLTTNDPSPPTSPLDVNCWQVVLSPSPPTSTSQLLGITALAPDEVWAVGNSIGVITHTLIERWTGSNWVIVPSPSPGSSPELRAVTAAAPNDAWAVGSSDGQPLALHWNGAQWDVAPLPAVGDFGVLNGVTAISSNDVWAVGSKIIVNNDYSLALHWDGTNWNSVSLPEPIYARLYAVDAIASNDIWAVGSYALLHWDGTNWNSVPAPELNVCYLGLVFLYGVSMNTSNDVWSVGYCPTRSPGIAYAWILHWDGSQWSAYSPDLNYYQGPILTSVSALAPDDVWAVGYRNAVFPPGGPRESLALHWDGTSWTQASVPQSGGGNNMLYGVAALAHDNVWSVGTFGDASSGNGQTLVQHYSLCAPCPGERFTDVCPTDYFYPHVQALADDGILSGYNTSPPCPNSQWISCFRPYNSSTRGQISKVVSLAAGFNEPVSGQTFQDVPPGATFYTYTERLTSRNIISGYPCGDPGEPCVPPENRPYFRTNHLISRGQLSKMVSLAFGWSEPVPYQSFQDVPPGSTFYDYIGRLFNRAIINGYPCGALGEPCIPPNNFPYFRPNNNVTRGQTAKIVQLARIQPTPTPTPTPTVTPLLTATPLSTPDLTATPLSTPDLTATPTSTATLTTR